MGPAATEPAADAHDCIMVESSKGTHRIQGCGATFVSPTAGSPQIDGRIRQPTVIRPDLPGPSDIARRRRQGWPSNADRVAASVRRPSFTASARDVTGPRQVGTEKRPSGRTKKLDQRIEKYLGNTQRS